MEIARQSKGTYSNKRLESVLVGNKLTETEFVYRIRRQPPWQGGEIFGFGTRGRGFKNKRNIIVIRGVLVLVSIVFFVFIKKRARTKIFRQ